MSDNPYESPHSVNEPPARERSKVGRRLFELLVVIAIIGILVALLLPAVRSSPEAARRVQCANNLKQIALALRNYESVYDALPPAYTVDAQGKPLHSWRTLILPYVEQKALYEKIDLSKPWDDPANKQACETSLSVYQCPSVALPANHTTYLAVVAPGGCFEPTAPRELSEITDAHGLTLMVLEVDAAHAVPWMAPKDAGEELIMGLLSGAKLPHPGGFQAAFVDGTVLFLPSRSSADRLRALISIAGDDDAIAKESN